MSAPISVRPAEIGFPGVASSTILPTAIVYEPVVPDLVRGLLAVMALLVAVSGAQDALAVRRLSRGEPEDRAWDRQASVG